MGSYSVTLCCKYFGAFFYVSGRVKGLFSFLSKPGEGKVE